LDIGHSFVIRHSSFGITLTPCRLIIDPSGEGAWNMALDEALLESAQNEGVATLRFYMWREPTLSLGYFQPHAQRQQHAASAGCALVRRASGGGAILHDQELTYSIALPGTHRLAARAEKLYQAVHESLIETLAELGVKATLCEAASPSPCPLPKGEGSASISTHPHLDKPFLCFQRHEPGDVLLAGHKVAGSAQRRQRGAVLQHGSVLWARSKFAPELPGIADLCSTVDKIAESGPGEVDRLRQRWLPHLAAWLEMNLQPEALSEATRTAAAEIQRRKFGDASWTYRR
jgi:lipoate-protein ligase A